MDAAFIGRAGEYRVASELLLRGFNPAIRAVDNGVDIVLDNGDTISVKTSLNKTSNGCHNIQFTGNRYRKNKKIKIYDQPKTNFVITWLISIDCFYIIPSSAIGKRFILSLGCNKSIWNKYKNNWNILGCV
jgi:hypothetical protein